MKNILSALQTYKASKDVENAIILVLTIQHWGSEMKYVVYLVILTIGMGLPSLFIYWQFGSSSADITNMAMIGALLICPCFSFGGGYLAMFVLYNWDRWKRMWHVQA